MTYREKLLQKVNLGMLFSCQRPNEIQPNLMELAPGKVLLPIYTNKVTTRRTNWPLLLFLVNDALFTSSTSCGILTIGYWIWAVDSVESVSLLRSFAINECTYFNVKIFAHSSMYIAIIVI